jgi:hypothetical protein
MKIEDKLDRIMKEANEPWSERFGIHSTTFETFLRTMQEDVLEFELEMRRRGRDPNMSKIRRFLGQLMKANKEVRKILVNVAKVEGI